MQSEFRLMQDISIAILVQIIYLGQPDGPTCHTGAETCYYTSVPQVSITYFLCLCEFYYKCPPLIWCLCRLLKSSHWVDPLESLIITNESFFFRLLSGRTRFRAEVYRFFQSEPKLLASTLYALEDLIAKRKTEEVAPGSKPSWTRRLQQDPKLLCSKIRYAQFHHLLQIMFCIQKESPPCELYHGGLTLSQ